MARDCRYAPLVILLAVIDDVELPELPTCTQPAVFSTVIAREHRPNGTVRSRTCARHDAAFRLDPGYRDSIRLPGPS
jgi:hypothetical protein